MWQYAPFSLERPIGGSHGPIIASWRCHGQKALQDLGSPADIALIDGKTKRQEWEGASAIDTSLYDEEDSPVRILPAN